MIVVFSLAIHLGYSWLTTEIVDPPPLLALLFEFALVMFVTFSTIAIFFRTTYKRAICSWLVTLIPAVAKVVLIFFVLNPFLLEAFVVANQSMSPVLRGTHQIGKCPSCGQQAIAGFHPEFERLDAYRRFGICLTCNKTDEIGDLIPVLQQPDRIIVNKIQTPKRWDIVLYKTLTNQPTNSVHRLVGLPGEEIIIKEGEIWINGIKAQPPAEISKINFIPDQYGSVESPLRLANDEYFVIGDLQEHSFDSRFMGPIPKGNIEGVVKVIYWPMSRWRIFE
ncbi:MAG: signal peptidase I [Zavarzinella sp.]